MLKRTYTFIGLLLTIMLGCCPPCEQETLGSFLLAPNTADWLDFVIINNRSFTSNLNQVETFSYSALQTGFEDMATNCDTESNCGICCDTFQGGFAYTQFASSNGTLIFDITIKKDFFQFLPTDAPETITDYLTITFNNSLTCDLSGLPNAVLTSNATINGKSFDKVLVCEIDAGANPGPSTPTAFYFTAEDGIVGYKLGNGTEWSLDD